MMMTEQGSTPDEPLERALAATVFVTIALTPLVYMPCHGDNVRALLAPKCWMALGGAVVSGALLTMWLSRRPPLRIATWLAVALGALGCGLAISIVTAADPYTDGLANLRPYLASFVVFMATMVSRRSAAAARSAIVAAAAVLAVEILLEEWGIQLPLLGSGASTQVLPPAGSFPHRNSAALVLLPAVVIIAARLGSARRRAAVVGYASLSAVVLAALIATRSRASLLALIVAVGVLLVAAPSLRPSPRRLLVMVGAASMTIVLHARSPMARLHDPLSRKMARAAMTIVGDGPAAFAGDPGLAPGPVAVPGIHVRGLLGRFALEEAALHPVSGVGVGRFQTEWSLRNPTRTSDGPHAHNVILHVAAEAGLLATVPLIVMIVGFIFDIGGVLRARKQFSAALLAACGASITLVVVAQFEMLVHAAGANLFAAALAGMVMAPFSIRDEVAGERELVAAEAA